jgi:8-oxo-dGTP pyrophosphatase MutT (NUDIX family)
MPAIPKLAATVILLRERVLEFESNDNCEFEVFMAKRHKKNKFLGGHHVFPGGAIDKQDDSKESRARVSGLEKNFTESLKEVYENPSSLWIIAIRELFEETGVLIASKENGDPTEIDSENEDKFRHYQELLQKDRDTMTNILTKENLYYAANNLKYFGRLVTPALSPIRFDTQFFLCKKPPNQHIHLFGDELVEGFWGTPRQILELNRKNQIKIIFPQYSTLRRLRKFITIQEAFDNSKTQFKKNWFITLNK